MSLGSGNAELEGRDDRPTKNAADPPPTSQSEALENLERRSVSPGTKKIIQSASAPNLADGHLFPAVRTNGSARRNATKGYTSLVALKQAIDITAGWRSPDLSVQEAARRRAAGPKDWSTVSAEPRKTAAVPAKPLRPVERTDSTQATGGEVSEESSDDDSDVDSVLDVQRTLINIAIFLSTIAGWKGLWDIQDQYLTSYYSLGIGAALYFLRVKVDDILDTHDVHEEDWYELFEKLPELSLFSIESLSAYGRIYLSSGLVFVSSLFIWRGLWQALDDINVVGPICIALSAVSFIALSLTQLSLERKRLRNPDGPRSPSMYDEDELFTMGRPHFYPEEFQSSSEDSVNDSEHKDGDVVRAGSAEGKKRAVRSESAGGRKEGEGGVREEVQRALNAVDEDEEEAGRIRVFGGEGEEEGHGGAGAPASVAKAEEGRGRRVVD